MDKITGTVKLANVNGTAQIMFKKRSDFPASGRASAEYVATDENKIYRYDKAAGKYVCIGTNPDGLQKQIDNIVIAGTSSGDAAAEVAQARVNANGETFGTLKERLDVADVTDDELKEVCKTTPIISLSKNSNFYCNSVDVGASVAINDIEYYVKRTDGTVVDDTTEERYFCKEISVKEGETYYVSSIIRYWVSAFAVYDTTGNIISYDNGDRSEDKLKVKRKIVIPHGGTTLRVFTYYPADKESIKIMRISELIDLNVKDDLPYPIKIADEVEKKLTWISGEYFTLDNNDNLQIVSDSTFSYAKIEVKRNDVLRIVGATHWGSKCYAEISETDDVIYITDSELNVKNITHDDIYVAKTNGTIYINKSNDFAIPTKVYTVKSDALCSDECKKISESLTPNEEVSVELTWNNGYYNITTGKIVDADKTALKHAIVSLEKGKTYHITGKSSWQALNFIVVDDNNTVVGSSDSSAISGNLVHDMYFDSNGTYMMYVNSLEAYTNATTVKEVVSYKPVSDTGNVLFGKKWVACGDSFTEGDFTGYVDDNGFAGKDSQYIYDASSGMYKTYPYWIGKRNKMTVINEAKCGSVLALDKTYVDDPTNVDINTKNPFSYERYKNIPNDADYITIWFGINDSYNCYLGTENDTTNETFYGAWDVVLRYLITNHPYAKIGIIVTESTNGNEWRDAIRQRARKWGIPVLDMMGNESVPPIFGRESTLGMCDEAINLRKNSFIVSDTNRHPNLEAHKYQSTFIENWLRSL